MRINIKKRKSYFNIAITVIVLIIVLAFTLKNIQDAKNAPLENETVTASVVSDADKLLVERYIRNNIANLAPERTTLGGTWQVTEIKINTTSRTGTFKYEDGHIEGEAEFRFTKNAANLLSLGIRKKA